MDSQSRRQWPEVTLGGVQAPYIDRIAGHEALLADPKIVVAYGEVSGVPWSLVAYKTKPIGNWWEQDPPYPVGPHMEFFLGSDGRHGGGGGYAGVPEGADLSLHGYFFGALPNIVAWVGFASDRVSQVDVRSNGESRKTIDVRHAPPGFANYFIFFPPRGIDGEVVALDSSGNNLQAERLHEVEVRADENSSTAIGSVGWRADSPPPGWPPTPPPEFAPGEGLRREEDFLLHNTSFPLYVVPPEAWDGIVALSGYTGPASAPTEIHFYYLDRPGHHTHGFEVGSEDPAQAGERLRLAPQSSPRGDSRWWISSLSDDSGVINFVNRFVEGNSERTAGPSRQLHTTSIQIKGASEPVEEWEFMSYPELLVLRIQLAEVVVSLRGWGLSESDLLSFASRLQRVELGSDLLGRMKNAQAASNEAWRIWYSREGGSQA